MQRLSRIERRRSSQGIDVIRKESQLITDFLTTTHDDGTDVSCSSESDISDEEKKTKTPKWNLGSVLMGRKSELEHETENTRHSLRTSFAGCEVNKRLVNKFGSIKAIMSENERMEQSGLFIIHPYLNFRFAWDMLTLVILLLNVILVPVFMAFPSFEFLV